MMKQQTEIGLSIHFPKSPAHAIRQLDNNMLSHEQIYQNPYHRHTVSTRVCAPMFPSNEGLRTGHRHGFATRTRIMQKTKRQSQKIAILQKHT